MPRLDEFMKQYGHGSAAQGAPARQDSAQAAAGKAPTSLESFMRQYGSPAPKPREAAPAAAAPAAAAQITPPAAPAVSYAEQMARQFAETKKREGEAAKAKEDGPVRIKPPASPPMSAEQQRAEQFAETKHREGEAAAESGFSLDSWIAELADKKDGGDAEEKPPAEPFMPLSDSWRLWNLEEPERAEKDGPPKEEKPEPPAEEDREQAEEDKRRSELEERHKALTAELDEIEANAGYITDPDAANAAQKRKSEIITELYGIDAELGSPARFYDEASRLGATLTGAAQEQGAGYLTAGGLALSLAGEQDETGRAIADSAYAGYATDPLSEANMRAAVEQGATPGSIGVLEENERLAEGLYGAADKLAEESAANLGRAKEGLTGFDALAVDLTKGAADLAGDALASLIAPGSGMAAMATRIFGNAAAEVRRDGGSVDKQLLAGLKAAGIEVLTEKIAGPFEKIYGRSFTGRAISRALDSLDNPVIAKALSMASDALGEGAEEILSDVLNPIADRLLKLDDGTGSIFKDTTLSQVLYDGLVGAILGMFGSAVKVEGGAVTGETIAEAEQQAVSAAAQAMDRAAQPASGALQETDRQEQMTEPAQILADQAAPKNETPAPAPGRNVEEQRAAIEEEGKAEAEKSPADLLAETAAGKQSAEPSQTNIDNAAANGYTEANETNLPEVENDGTGRGIEEDRGGVPGVYEGRDSDHPGQGRPDGALADSGSKLLSPESQNSLKQSGVYVETQASTDNAAFSAALDEARAADADHGWAVTPKSAEELSAAGTRAFITPDGTAGYAIAKDGDIEAVFANKAKGAPKGVSRSTIPQAIANGGTKLDCYGSGLVRLYSKHGFVPVARVTFNPEYANPGWDSSKGSPDIYFMMYTGQSADESVRNYGTYPIITQAELDALPVMDYDAAYQYRDGLLEEQNRNSAESRQGLADEREGIPAPGTISEKFNTASGEFNAARNAEAETQGAGEASPQSASLTASLAQGSLEEGPVPAGKGNPPDGSGETPDDAPGMKRSQTESNTLSGIAEKLGGEQESLYYVPISERQTLTEAVNRVSADSVGEMQALMDKEMWTAADIDTGLTLYGMLKADALRSGDNSAANAWAKIVQERGTRSGQALQAFGKWTRSAAASAVKAQEQLEAARQEGKISPEEAQRIGNDIYGFAQELDAIGDGDLTSLRELIERQGKYRGTGTFFEKNFMRMLEEVEDFDWLREYATRQLMNMADDVTVTADLGQKLKTWQVNSQLTRLGTFFRNIGGNVVFGVQDTLTQDGLGVALDWMVSRFTGKRTVGVDRSWFSADGRAGARDALVRSILEVAGDVDMTGRGNRYGTTANRTFKMSGNGFERFMSRWEQLLGYSLTTSDRVSRGQIETAVQEGLEGFDLTDEERAELGKTMADYRLFQNKGRAYEASKKAHDALNAIASVGGEIDSNGKRTGGFGLGDLINPYPGVPANLGVKALEYSPANIARGGVELFQLLKNVKHDKITTADGKTGERVSSWTAAQQQKAVMDVARGFAGVPMIVLLTALFKSGLAKNADDEEDPDAAAQKRSEGRTGVQVNLDAALRAFKGESGEWKDGDDLLSIGWLEPMNAFMAIASMIAEEDGEDATLSSYAKDYFNGAVQSVLEMPVMQNIANAVDAFRYSTAEDLGGKFFDMAVSLAGDGLIGMIPAPVGQAARTIDQYYRDVSSDDPFEQVWNNLRNVIPDLRETLPIKTDNFGNPKEYSDSAVQRFLNNYVLPGAINEINQTETSAAVERLYEATGDAHVYPDRNAPTSFKVGGSTYRLSAEQRRAYHETYGSIVEQYYSEVLLDDKYANWSDMEKLGLLSQIREYANYKAKQERMGGPELYADLKWSKIEETMKKSGIGLIDAMTWKGEVGGKMTQENVYEYLIGSDYTDEQRAAMWGEMGWKESWEDYRASTEKAQEKEERLSSRLEAVGITLDDYNAGTAAADVNGNKKVTQDELYTWLTGSDYTDQQKEVIWSTMGWKKNWADYLAGLATKNK